MGAVNPEKENAKRLCTFDDYAEKSGEDARDINRNLERSVCGGFLGDPLMMLQHWRVLTQSIKEPHTSLFQHSQHQVFAKWIIELIEAGEYIDALTIIKAAKEQSQSKQEQDLLESLGGIKGIVGYAAAFFSIDSSKNALEKLIEQHNRQKFATLASNAVEQTHEGKSIRDALMSLTQQARPLVKVETRLYTVAEDLIDQSFERLTNPEEEGHYIPSCFPELSLIYGRMLRQNMLLLGAPTGNGKTAYVMQEIDFALKGGRTVDAFLMESVFDQYLSRHIARECAIPLSKFIRKNLSEAEYEAARAQANIAKQYKDCIHFSPAESLSALDIRLLIEQRKQKTGKPCDLIVIDNIDAMKGMKQNQSPADFSFYVDTMNELYDICAAENAAMIVVAQLNVESVRSSFQKKSRLPTMGAFRGGAPTQRAKIAVILHKDDQDMLSNTPVVEQKMVIVKANNGSCGVVDSLFLGPFAMHLEDVAPVSHVTGKRMDLGHYRKLNHGKLLNRLGFDCDKPRGGDDEEQH